jgi:hypothetical protein
VLKPIVLFERGLVLFKIRRLLALLALCSLAAASLRAQAPHAFPFRATHYDVEVILHPEDQTISALVKVDFIATQVAKTLLVELHPDLRVNSVRWPQEGSSPTTVTAIRRCS